MYRRTLSASNSMTCAIRLAAHNFVLFLICLKIKGPISLAICDISDTFETNEGSTKLDNLLLKNRKSVKMCKNRKCRRTLRNNRYSITAMQVIFFQKKYQQNRRGKN